ncbi:MAG TPA: potassium transporter TrkA [Chromatiales bacterium]|nr:potassium transporter TrkA [Chromatiales bacterium]
MDSVVFLILRRMRVPLLVLVIVYAVAVLGFVLIPGEDDQGRPWHMGFFHAFYFVSFMGTTIGFGEIPYPFTDAQRFWALFMLYATVTAWIYSIGTLIALVQDPAFKRAVTEQRFARRVRRMVDPFYLVCGYGDTGSALVASMSQRNQHAVVVDIEPRRIAELDLQALPVYVPGLCADAAVPRHLIEAGLEHRCCRGVVALTNVNEVNLKVAISSKLLRPGLMVVCRADARDVEANMASFGTDHIVDPFETFAELLETALRAPCQHLVHDWLGVEQGTRLPEPIYPPLQGLWIVCGYGRFGKAVIPKLEAAGLDVVVIEATPERTGTPPQGCVVGWGTEAGTLLEAGADRAAAIVAGTNNDTNNLSIIMTAREINPDLFVVLRQNEARNDRLFETVHADIRMHPSRTVAEKVRILLNTPLLYRFFGSMREETNQWACELASRMAGLVGDRPPEVWEVEIGEAQAHAVAAALEHGDTVPLGLLLVDPREPDRALRALALAREHGDRFERLPPGDRTLALGDRLLFCGAARARTRQEWVLQNERVLADVRQAHHAAGESGAAVS